LREHAGTWSICIDELHEEIFSGGKRWQRSAWVGATKGNHRWQSDMVEFPPGLFQGNPKKGNNASRFPTW
jgi:hypothetical protein